MSYISLRGSGGDNGYAVVAYRDIAVMHIRVFNGQNGLYFRLCVYPRGLTMHWYEEFDDEKDVLAEVERWQAWLTKHDFGPRDAQ